MSSPLVSPVCVDATPSLVNVNVPWAFWVARVALLSATSMRIV